MTSNATEAISGDAILALIDQLQATLERADAAQVEAIRLCDRIHEANVDGDSAWGLVSLEVACVRDVLPGGQSEGDPLEALDLVRDLAELAARRST